jgi:hypothetical protein
MERDYCKFYHPLRAFCQVHWSPFQEYNQSSFAYGSACTLVSCSQGVGPIDLAQLYRPVHFNLCCPLSLLAHNRPIYAYLVAP